MNWAFEPEAPVLSLINYTLQLQIKNHWLQKKNRTYHPEEGFVGKVRILVDGRQHTED